MYNNIGKKIKVLAKVLCIIQIVGLEIAGFALMVDGYEEEVAVALLIMLVAPVICWVMSWFLYGFGELIDKTCDIARNTRPSQNKSETQYRADEQRIKNLEDLRAQGLITEEEFMQAING